MIYEENHSFDNLYGLWGDVGGDHLDGLADRDAAHTTQISQAGNAYQCLKQLDVNLDTDAAGNTLSKVCNPETVTFPDNSTVSYTSHFPNAPFNIDQYIPNNMPSPEVLHRFYHEQQQIDGGKMDKFVLYNTTSHGMAMGYYHTMALPLAAEAGKYTLCDHFFHAAFGGSFLNH